MKIAAWVDDNRRWFLPTSILLFVCFVGLLVFWMVSLRGMEHLADSFAVWRHQNLGGVRETQASSLSVYTELRVADANEFDKLDISALTLYVTGTSMTDLFDDIASRNGRVRILALDPRWASHEHAQHDRFVSLARVFGQEPWQLAAESRHSTALLLYLRERYPESIEIRFHSGPSDHSSPPFLLPARSYQLYKSNSENRFDVVVPRIDVGTDSVRHPAVLVKSRRRNKFVVLATDTFKQQWENGTVLDASLFELLLAELQR